MRLLACESVGLRPMLLWVVPSSLVLRKIEFSAAIKLSSTKQVRRKLQQVVEPMAISNRQLVMTIMIAYFRFRLRDSYLFRTVFESQNGFFASFLGHEASLTPALFLFSA